MRLNKQLLGAFASASALALCGVAATNVTAPTTVQAVTSSINNLINSSNYSVPSIEYWDTFFTEGTPFTPQGIVVHETATPNATALNEANYFYNNWNTALTMVHALVDDQQIIQIHPTNETVWGAGPAANGRFIQIELSNFPVGTTSREKFAKSVNNDAYYIATLLKQYNLTPDNAESDGTGTVWSHHAVSKFLGGTNHTDPTGYFASWGYSMDQFFDLIVQKYNALGGTVQPPQPDYSNAGKTEWGGSAIASVENKTAIPVYTAPGKSATGQTLKPKSRWKVSARMSYNGTMWYKIGNNQWINGSYAYVTGVGSIPLVTENEVTPPPASNLMGTTSNSGNPVARVEYNKSSIAVFKKPASGVNGQYLKPGTSWKVIGRATALGRTWYQVGANQWIDGQYLYVTGYSQIPVVNTSNPTPPAGSSLMGTTSTSGKPVARVEYKKSSIAVFNKPASGVNGQYLKPGTSWKVIGRATALGRTWYQVGANQWIDGQYLYVTGYNQIPVVNPTQPPAGNGAMGTVLGTGNPVAKVVYNKSSIAVFKNPASGFIGKYLKPNTSWKVTGKRSTTKGIWYRVGTNQWIDGQYLYVTGYNKIPNV